MSDTPRTDWLAERNYNRQQVPADFARELERENELLRDAINEVISRPDFTTPQAMIHRLSACLAANQ